MSLVSAAHRHRRAVLFTIAAIVLAGVYAAWRLPTALFPPVTFPRIVVLADNGEQPIERMLVEVTRPLEEAARGVQGVTTVQSTTSRGSTEISVNLGWGADIYHALQLLEGRIAAVRTEIPASATVQVERMDVSVFPILGFTLTSDTRSPAELHDLALYTLRPALLRVAGVGRVDVVGGDKREIEVTVDPAALAARRLDLRAVSGAIAAANLAGATGLVADNYQLYLGVVNNAFQNLQDVENVVVASPGGVPVHVRDVARVGMGSEPVLTRISAEGRPAVLVDVCRQPEGNTVRIGKEARAAIAALGPRLPADVRCRPYMDQSEFIADSIAGTRDAIVVGVVLAMGVLLVFLRNLRIMFVAALVVPATIATTLGCLYAIGQTINIMTLGGIAAAVGLVIDDVIVVVESIFHHFRRGQALVETASAAVGEFLPAVVGSSLATLVIHIPFAFLGGITGRFFAALSITMVFALSISFLFSIVLAPLVAAAVLSPHDIETGGERERRRMSAPWLCAYAGALRWLLGRKVWALPVLALLLCGAALLYRHVGTGFMPDMDEGSFVLDYITPPGTSLEETSRMLRTVEDILRDTPEIANYGRRIGTQLGFFITEPNTGDILVKLRPGRRRSIFEVIDEVRARIQAAQPAMQIEFGQQMQDVIGDLIDNPAPIEIQVFGENTAEIHSVARRVAAMLEGVPGVEDVYDGITISGPSIDIHVDPERAARAGLTVQDVEEQLAVGMHGEAGTRLVRGDRVIGVRTRLPDAWRQDLDALGSTFLAGSTGLVPLSTIATLSTTPGQAEITRRDLQRMVSVTARIADRDLGSTIADVQRGLRREVGLPPGVQIVIAGTWRTQQEAFRGLLAVLGAGALFVCIVLLFEFESLRVPLTVFAINLPALFGVVFALWVTGVTFNVSSFVGTILVVGIVAENAIFLLHYVELYRKQGRTLDAALVEASLARARPILMTTCAAVLALLPLAVGGRSGTQMQQPLAIAVIGGFTISTLLLLFALPMVYGAWARRTRAPAGPASMPPG